MDDLYISKLIAPFIGYSHSTLEDWNSPLAPEVRFFWQKAYRELSYPTAARSSIETYYGPSMLLYLIQYSREQYK